jgi:hypothetical protein
VNSLSAFLDGSQIYGVDAERAAAMSTLSGGCLATGDGCSLLRNSGRLTLHTRFVREHNRLADETAAPAGTRDR